MAEGPIHQSNSVLEDTDHDSYTGSMGGDETMSESEYCERRPLHSRAETFRTEQVLVNAVEHTDAEEKHETPASPSLSSAGPISGKDDPSKPKDSEEAALSAMTLTSGVQGSTVMVAHAAEIPSADNPDTQGPTGDSKSSVPPEDHKSDSERSILSRLQELEDHAQQVSVIIGIPSKRPPILEDGGAVPAEEKKSYSLAIKVKELNAKRFNSRSASDFYLIEILMNDRSKKEHYRERSRYFASSLTDTDETKILLQDLPSQIRIRSPYLLDLLEEASQGGLTYPDEGSSRNVGTSQMLFLYPFKVFVTYERQIREKLEKRLKEATDAIAEKEHTAKTTEEDLESVNAQASTSSHEKPDVNRSTPKKKSARGRQERHIIEIKALIQLFDQNLKGVFDLRHRFQEGKVSMILWDHLWLLYTIGGLVFQREPDAGHDPKLLRVAQFHGGRRIINEEQSHNAGGQAHESKKITAPKEKDTCFYISAFYIESDGASFFPVQEAIRIPHWDGLRHVRELRLFPFDFCQQGKDKDFDQPTKELWMQDLIDRGKRFAGLGSVAFKYFNGHSFGQDREQVNLLKTHRSWKLPD